MLIYTYIPTYIVTFIICITNIGIPNNSSKKILVFSYIRIIMFYDHIYFTGEFSH